MQPNPTYEGNQEIPWIQFFMNWPICPKKRPLASPGGGQEARRSPNMAAQGKKIPWGENDGWLESLWFQYLYIYT